ncbi:GAF domain-containing protein [Pseudorhodoplanes sinuspersici]|uniref:GAF domain-containing protein n=1 Tax=Pseudorhodoplanes sinuspersici TaxID=1235591 RepID=UPI001FD961F2|nr:GAF domain-containing protein [Pseudorhodoplanes sinuspersici]
MPDAITDDTGTLLPMDREHAICNYVVANDETLVISDIERDPRFVDNEMVEQWNMRFYAGAPPTVWYLRVSPSRLIILISLVKKARSGHCRIGD